MVVLVYGVSLVQVVVYQVMLPVGDSIKVLVATYNLMLYMYRLDTVKNKLYTCIIQYNTGP